ncbi:MAG: divergent polysaccharide deacetylase family protein [Alphaproteobacteria bacterium]|nr:divergent polysaccharide deacetylase family protein [Alphaproteobacteria bacterium]
MAPSNPNVVIHRSPLPPGARCRKQRKSRTARHASAQPLRRQLSAVHRHGGFRFAALVASVFAAGVGIGVLIVDRPSPAAVALGVAPIEGGSARPSALFLQAVPPAEQAEATMAMPPARLSLGVTEPEPGMPADAEREPAPAERVAAALAPNQVPASRSGPPDGVATELPPSHLVAALPGLDTGAIGASPVRPHAVPDRLPTWKRFAVAAPATHGRALVAVVIDDMGVDRARSARAAQLPGPLTLSYLPYAGELRRQAASARAAGHELMLHLPMEPNRSDDPGPHALKVADSPQALKASLSWALGQFDGFVGANNHMGSRFTADHARMRLVLQELNRRGLMFLDSRTTPHSVGGAVAREIGMPSLDRDIFLDHIPGYEPVLGQLAKTEALARKTGAAIVIGHPLDGTIEALAQWLPRMAERGLALVPLTAILERASAPVRLAHAAQAAR